ncbi:MAG TPA: type III pantothenate kinase [Spirochaetes bacterium]|jgi:type III pantothenate kinase|nr:type III pantothenate kinase [Spirochaetota bacterium]
MLLCIDIGNTNMVLGLWGEGKWAARWRVRTAHDKMPDEYAMLLKTLLKDKKYELEDISRVIIASVVPNLKTVLKDLFDRYLGLKPLVLGPGVRTGLSIRIDNPSELGADLVADAVAAYDRLKETCIIVDFGTATTFSAVSGSGEFLGVSIAPGIEVAAQALSTRTAQLPHINLVPPPNVIGTNTTNSMQSGLIFGYIGLVEGLIRRIRDELGGKAAVIATGGLSEIFAPLTKEIDIIDLDLTLEGLRLIGERN